MSSIYDWSTSAGDNANSDNDINLVEGQAPGTLNDAQRGAMGRVAELRRDITGALIAGGSANALTVTAGSGYTTYADGRMVTIRATSVNTGPATLSVNAIGAKSIRKFSSSGETALTGGEMQINGIYIFVYRTELNTGAGGWVLVNASTSAGGGPTALLTTRYTYNAAQVLASESGWSSFPINTETFDGDSIVTLSSNAFTLTTDAWLKWRVQMYADGGTAGTVMATRLYNITDAVVVDGGSVWTSSDASDIRSQMLSVGQAPLTASKQYRIEYYVVATGTAAVYIHGGFISGVAALQALPDIVGEFELYRR